jgi:hypothetical protein
MITEKLVIQMKLTSTYSLELRAGQKSSKLSLQACGCKKALILSGFSPDPWVGKRLKKKF